VFAIDGRCGNRGHLFLWPVSIAWKALCDTCEEGIYSQVIFKGKCIMIMRETQISSASDGQMVETFMLNKAGGIELLGWIVKAGTFQINTGFT